MSNGYIRVYVPGHPTAAKDGYALEHRYILYEHGIIIPKGLHVHHKNSNKEDNRIDNLEVHSPKEHKKQHIMENPNIINQFGVFVAEPDEQERKRKNKIKAHERYLEYKADGRR
jgi:hypothetical protein